MCLCKMGAQLPRPASVGFSAHIIQARFGTLSPCAVIIPNLAKKPRICNQSPAQCMCRVLQSCHSAVCRPSSTDSLGWGDYGVLRFLTANAEAAITCHLPPLVCVYIQEPVGVSGQKHSHVDPPAMPLQLLCHFVPARGLSKITWKKEL